MRNKYKREDLYTVIVFAYVNPVRLDAVSENTSWYAEGKILFSDKFNVVALVDGWRTRYDVVVYSFKKVKNTPDKLERLISFIRHNYRRSNGKKYQGWIHHANLYGGISRSYKGQLKLNFRL